MVQVHLKLRNFTVGSTISLRSQACHSHMRQLSLCRSTIPNCPPAHRSMQPITCTRTKSILDLFFFLHSHSNRPVPGFSNHAHPAFTILISPFMSYVVFLVTTTHDKISSRRFRRRKTHRRHIRQSIILPYLRWSLIRIPTDRREERWKFGRIKLWLAGRIIRQD